MKKLLTFKDLLPILSVSEATLRRWLAETRKGIGDFPKPINGFKRKLLWSPSDIEFWLSRHQKSAPVCNVEIESATQRSKRYNTAMKALEKKGVKIRTPQEGGQ